MQQKLIKIDKSEFIPATFSGKNDSGLTPYGNRVVVLTDQAAERTSGGIYLDDLNRERLTMAATTGVLIAAGPDAFTFNLDGTPITGRVPVPGDRVYTERFSGQPHYKGTTIYRLMESRCIGAIIEDTTNE